MKEDLYVCVECERSIPWAELAYDSDPEHRLGVCDDCARKLEEEKARPAWTGREVA
jgi:DNA-directed RNA polymerase subunit RPC12/RpoP